MKKSLTTIAVHEMIRFRVHFDGGRSGKDAREREEEEEELHNLTTGLREMGGGRGRRCGA